MRIGIDCRLWNESGVGRYTRNLVKQLWQIDKKNTYIAFVLKKDKEYLRQALIKEKIFNWHLVVADIRWHSLEEQLRFPSFLYNQNLDLVHFPYFSVPILYRKPYIVTIHDLILHHFPTGEASTLPKILYKGKLIGYYYIISQAAKHARKIITVSSTTKKEIIDHLRIAEEKIIVTYEGAEQAEQIVLALKTQKAPFKKYFLYVGNAYPHKNLLFLIKTFKQFLGEKKEKTQDLKLVFIGRNDYFYKKLKEKVKEMGLDGHIIFIQNATDKELARYYQNALALIMPSKMEGFGLPALEAMVNHCLVIASDIPALREVCVDAALYFDPTDSLTLKKQLEVALGLAENQKNKEMIIKKGIENLKQYSWQTMAKETLKIYTSALL